MNGQCGQYWRSSCSWPLIVQSNHTHQPTYSCASPELWPHIICLGSHICKFSCPNLTPDRKWRTYARTSSNLSSLDFRIKREPFSLDSRIFAGDISRGAMPTQILATKAEIKPCLQTSQEDDIAYPTNYLLFIACTARRLLCTCFFA